MKDYEGLVGKIRENRGGVDYDRMLSLIERRISRRQTGMRVVLAGVLTALLLVFAGYYYYPVRQAESGILMSYVFEQESIDGPLLDYVFSE